eukprot:767028-Hanusia_phi.AAC.4
MIKILGKRTVRREVPLRVCRLRELALDRWLGEVARAMKTGQETVILHQPRALLCRGCDRKMSMYMVILLISSLWLKDTSCFACTFPAVDMEARLPGPAQHRSSFQDHLAKAVGLTGSPSPRINAAHLKLRMAIESMRATQGKSFGDQCYPEGKTEFIAECQMPTDRGMFRLRSYRYRGAKVVTRNGERVLEWTEMEPVVMVSGDLRGKEGVVVRVHDQCFTSEVLGSKRCDCKEQLDMALNYINLNSGAIIYMPQEGRGIGLANKIAAYQLQDNGLDTVDANRHLGFEDDERSYDCVPAILEDMGIQSVQLVTNNPYKIQQLTDVGVKIDRTKPSLVEPNTYNVKYLRTKAARMSHSLKLDLSEDTKEPAGLSFGSSSVLEAAASLAAGKLVVMIDGQRGFLLGSAQTVTSNSLASMSKYTSGVLWAPLDKARQEELELTDLAITQLLQSTGGTSSVLLRSDTWEGVAADARLQTLHRLLNGTVESLDQIQGHILPVAVDLNSLKVRGSVEGAEREEGQETRRRRTRVGGSGMMVVQVEEADQFQASLLLLRSAGLETVACMGELAPTSGEGRMEDLDAVYLARKCGFCITSLSDVLEHAR